MIICKGLNENDPINSVGEWFEKCPPEQGLKQWVDGRSAKELAKYWCANSSIPLEFQKLIDSHEDLTITQLYLASPEYETRFDRYGKGRQHDLIILGSKDDQKIVIGIEAKVDEGFGNDTIGEYYLESLIRRMNGEHTKVPDRIEKLAAAIFPHPIRLSHLDSMYQLVHTTAGVMVEAKRQGANKAVIVINTFLTEKIDKTKLKKNSNDLNFFLKSISSNKYKKIQSGQVLGPLRLPGSDYIPSDIDFYIGKLDTL